MAQFGVFVEGLNELREELSSERLSRNTTIGLAKAVNDIHKTLQAEVFKRYGFRQQLASVRVGGSHDTRYLPGSRAVIEQELVYEGKAVPLKDFNHISIFDIKKKSFFHGSFYDVPGSFERKAPLERVQVTVVRQGGMKNITKDGVRAFTIDGNIVSRRNTKRGNPTQRLKSPDYDRMDIKTLYGPSLPEAAAWVYENNPVVQAKIEEVSFKILDELTKP
jgi:hypothetical protein